MNTEETQRMVGAYLKKKKPKTCTPPKWKT